MAALTVVLVDSSVWIDLLRDVRTAQTLALRQLLPEGEAALAPVNYQKILQGAVSVERVTRLKRCFRTLPFPNPVHPVETREAAAELYVRCRLRGVPTRSPNDCLVGRIAVEQKVPLLHDDGDFEAIAKAEPRLKFAALT